MVAFALAKLSLGLSWYNCEYGDKSSYNSWCVYGDYNRVDFECNEPNYSGTFGGSCFFCVYVFIFRVLVLCVYSVSAENSSYIFWKEKSNTISQYVGQEKLLLFYVYCFSATYLRRYAVCWRCGFV